MKSKYTSKISSGDEGSLWEIGREKKTKISNCICFSLQRSKLSPILTHLHLVGVLVMEQPEVVVLTVAVERVVVPIVALLGHLVSQHQQE